MIAEMQLESQVTQHVPRYAPRLLGNVGRNHWSDRALSYLLCYHCGGSYPLFFPPWFFTGIPVFSVSSHSYFLGLLALLIVEQVDRLLFRLSPAPQHFYFHSALPINISSDNYCIDISSDQAS